ncbi:MAG: hypothetical protein BWY25_00573 [Chloroflexi bacterium ADurb.Bin222]|nr:MAG: hypothetical protein BWY25_00573 [Chloroflexi bacterium ADurb.Bin222]
MDEIAAELKHFLEYWFAGFEQGLEALEPRAQAALLHMCGRACAQSYTVPLFREAWQQSGEDLECFLQRLSQGGLKARYERLDATTLKATYFSCDCDLVRLGLVKSPALCECSAANLGENLEQALGMPVSVAIEGSILRGGSECVFRVSLKQEDG